MASKQGGTYRNQQRITVDYIGNKIISWVGEEEVSSSSNQSSPDQLLDSSQPLSTQLSDAELPDPTSDEELRERFVAYVHQNIEALHGEGDDGSYAPTAKEKARRAIEKKGMYMLLAILHDASSRPRSLRMSSWDDWKIGLHPEEISLANFFESRCYEYQASLDKLCVLWDLNPKPKKSDEPVAAAVSRTGKNRATDEGVETRRMKKQRIEKAQGTSQISSDEEADSVTQPASHPPVDDQCATGNNNEDRRTGKEIAAQKEVPEWYAGRCVLSNALGAQGAHIVPVRALVKAERNHTTFRNLLRMFWPDKHWTNHCSPDKTEKANILPLEAGAHYRWDRFNFAVRPINNVSDTDPCRLWIQMVWLNNTHESGGLASGSWEHFDGTISNYRRGICMDAKEGGTHQGRTTQYFPVVDHGDVFLLQTPDPEKYPLPDRGYLEIQFAVHKILSGIAAAGALKDIFRGPPPDSHEPGSVPVSVAVPWEWEFLLERAGEIGILDTKEEERWRQAIRAYLHEVEEEEAWTESWMLAMSGEARHHKQELEGKGDTGESSEQQQTEDERD